MINVQSDKGFYGLPEYRVFTGLLLNMTLANNSEIVHLCTNVATY